MGRKVINLTGRRFGRWTVMGRAGSRVWSERPGGTTPTWDVRCDCGTSAVVVGGDLRKGQSSSCGCLRVDNMRRMSLRHGMAGTPEYVAWTSMHQRCSNPRTKSFKSHGARGIQVCDRWTGPEGFDRFLEDMGRRPAADLSLDRIDNNGNYEPANCRWATWTTQARNKRNSRVLVVEGESATLAEWAERMGIGKSTIKERLRRGWTEVRAVLTKP